MERRIERRIERIIERRNLEKRIERERERIEESERVESERVERERVLTQLENFLFFEESKNISIKNGSVIKYPDCLSKCVICIEYQKNDDIIREIKHCKHSFHVKCIDDWFLENNSCPECRYYICKPFLDIHQQQNLPGIYMPYPRNRNRNYNI